MSMAIDNELQLRCPEGPRKLLGKLKLRDEQPVVTSDNLIEMSCQDCRRALVRNGQNVELVLHRFNIIGELIETEVVRRTT